MKKSLDYGGKKNEKNIMYEGALLVTLEEFRRDVMSRPLYYAVIQRLPTAPVTAIIHINNVIVVPYHPAVLILSEHDNLIQISSIQSIKPIETGYAVICGLQDDLMETIFLCREKPDCLSICEFFQTVY